MSCQAAPQPHPSPSLGSAEEVLLSVFPSQQEDKAGGSGGRYSGFWEEQCRESQSYPRKHDSCSGKFSTRFLGPLCGACTCHLILAYIRKCHPFQELRELLNILKVFLFKVSGIHSSVHSLELRSEQILTRCLRAL